NLALLRKHHAQNIAAAKRSIDVEVSGVRIGDFALVTFPGELTVRIGLNIKQKSPHDLTFVAGYTNGYIYYAPTAEQLLNVGGAGPPSGVNAPPRPGVGEGPRPMVPPRLLGTSRRAGIAAAGAGRIADPGRTAEFSGHDEQHAFVQTARRKILDQRRNRQIV